MNRRILGVFVLLQVLDVLSTLACFRAGLVEANPLVHAMLGLGNMTGLVAVKLASLALVGAAVYFRRPRAIVKVNYLYTGVVAWNCALLFLATRV